MPGRSSSSSGTTGSESVAITRCSPFFEVDPDLGHRLGHVSVRRAGGFVGLIDVGIQLDRDPAVIASCLNRFQHGREIDGSVPRDQMAVDPRGGDILEVVVPGVGSHLRDPVLRLLADAKGVADIKVQANPGRIDGRSINSRN